MASVKRDDCRAAGATSTMIASAADANARGLTSPQYRGSGLQTVRSRCQMCEKCDQWSKKCETWHREAMFWRPDPQSERRDNVTIESDGARVADTERPPTESAQSLVVLAHPSRRLCRRARRSCRVSRGSAPGHVRAGSHPGRGAVCRRLPAPVDVG